MHKKNLGIDVAIAYWNLLLSDKFPNFSVWTGFLEGRKGETRFVSKDQWVLLLQFAQTHGFEDLTFPDFREEEEWPVLIDDFVEWARAGGAAEGGGAGQKK